jgi:hypothetical protein
MNIDNMTKEQLESLYFKTAKKLGIYPMMAVSVSDVKQRLLEKQEEGDIEAIPSDDSIKRACSYVWRKYEAADDWMSTVEWICEESIENNEEKDVNSKMVYRSEN